MFENSSCYMFIVVVFEASNTCDVSTDCSSTSDQFFLVKGWLLLFLQRFIFLLLESVDAPVFLFLYNVSHEVESEILMSSFSATK